ncbi:MAG: hypothetical protein Fur0022_47740 [Anaerolineales bacterium]
MPKVKRLTPKEEAALKAAAEEVRQIRQRNFRRELLGVFVGIGVVLIISALVPAIRANYSLGPVILWGGAIGGIMMSLERFERAGGALTKKNNRLLNYLIGLGIPVGIMILLLWVQSSP